MPLRVIAGAARGRRLVAPKGGTRPTTDRLKEALFASLGHRIDDAAVLDLYAGSGALAIEALSRGAARCWSTATPPPVAVRANLRDHRLRRRRHVHCGRQWSGSYAPAPARPFDLVFLDPPYGVPSTEVAAVLEQLRGAPWLRPGATVVVERPKGATPIELPDGWGTEKERAYGDTLLVVAIA